MAKNGLAKIGLAKVGLNPVFRGLGFRCSGVLVEGGGVEGGVEGGRGFMVFFCDGKENSVSQFREATRTSRKLGSRSPVHRRPDHTSPCLRPLTTPRLVNAETTVVSMPIREHADLW